MSQRASARPWYGTPLAITAPRITDKSRIMPSLLGSCFRLWRSEGSQVKDEMSEDNGSVNKDAITSNPNRMPLVVRAKGHHIFLDNGKTVLDACGGAAVACLGHGNREVFKAMESQAKKFSYISWATFESQPLRDLQDWFVKSSRGVFCKAYLLSSGREVPGPTLLPMTVGVC